MLNHKVFFIKRSTFHSHSGARNKAIKSTVLKKQRKQAEKLYVLYKCVLFRQAKMVTNNKRVWQNKQFSFEQYFSDELMFKPVENKT